MGFEYSPTHMPHWSDVWWASAEPSEYAHGSHDAGCRHLFSTAAMHRRFIGFLIEPSYRRGHIKLDATKANIAFAKRNMIGGSVQVIDDVTAYPMAVNVIDQVIGLTNTTYPYSNGVFVLYDGRGCGASTNSWNTLVLRIWLKSLLYTNGVGIKSWKGYNDEFHLEYPLAQSRIIAPWHRKFVERYPDMLIAKRNLNGIIFWGHHMKAYVQTHHLKIKIPSGI